MATPVPVAGGVVVTRTGTLLLSEGLAERGTRTPGDYAAIGHALAGLHQAHGEVFGLADFDGFFGALWQCHPEVDLALVDYFTPVHPELLRAYAQIAGVDAGFAERRELWRLHAYLGVIAVDGANPFGRSFLPCLAAAVRQYT